MKNTKLTGDTAEAKVLAALVANGEKVLLPFGENHRYDLVLDRDGTFYRVQVKSGRLRDGCLVFNTYSTHHHRGGTAKGYVGEVDTFGVYCPDTGECYLFPIEVLPERRASFRVEDPKSVYKTMKFAKDYILPP